MLYELGFWCFLFVWEGWERWHALCESLCLLPHVLGVITSSVVFNFFPFESLLFHIMCFLLGVQQEELCEECR